MSEVGATGVVLPSAMWVFVSAEGRVHHNEKWPGKTVKMRRRRTKPMERNSVEIAIYNQTNVKKLRIVWVHSGSDIERK